MSWTVHVLKNSIKCSAECMKALYEICSTTMQDAPLCGDDLEYYGTNNKGGILPLDFNAMEHIDPIPYIREILIKYKANGELHFADLEGGYEPNFWGYRFTDGACETLKGLIIYKTIGADKCQT